MQKLRISLIGPSLIIQSLGKVMECLIILKGRFCDIGKKSSVIKEDYGSRRTTLRISAHHSGSFSCKSKISLIKFLHFKNEFPISDSKFIPGVI